MDGPAVPEADIRDDFGTRESLTPLWPAIWLRPGLPLPRQGELKGGTLGHVCRGPHASAMRLGGARAVLATVASAQAMTPAIDGLAVRGRLVVVGVDAAPIQVSPLQLIGASRSTVGHVAGTSIDRRTRSPSARCRRARRGLGRCCSCWHCGGAGGEAADALGCYTRPHSGGHEPRLAVVQLGVSVVNAALESIGSSFGGGGVAGLQSVVNAYTVVFASPILTSGARGDRLGAKRLFLAGFLLFVVASPPSKSPSRGSPGRSLLSQALTATELRSVLRPIAEGYASGIVGLIRVM